MASLVIAEHDNKNLKDATAKTLAAAAQLGAPVHLLVAGQGCEAVAVVCTNMRGAGVAAPLELKLGVPVFDSIAVTLWACLVATGVDPARIRGWGGLFTNPGLAVPKSPIADLRDDVQGPQHS